MHMSVETIYQTIYVQAKGKLKKNITHLLRSGRTQRKPLTTRAKRPRFREPMVMISDRPASVNDRAIPKHWEGDLITGRNNKSAIGTLVERSTRFTILLHLPHGHSAMHVQDAIIKKMHDLPSLMRLSLTWNPWK